MKIMRYLLFILIIGIALSNSINADSLKDMFQYVSPIPGAKLVAKETSIILRQGDILAVSRSDLTSIAIIEGSVSGIHKYDAVFSDDKKTIILKPVIPFTPGETVSINFTSDIEAITGKQSGETDYQFTISPKLSNQPYEYSYEEDYPDYAYRENASIDENSGNEDIVLDYDPSLPNDFNELTVNISNNPADGFIFLAKHRPMGPTYLMILDNTGYPVFYKRMAKVITDFKKQPNNLLSYFMYSRRYFYVMDSTYALIDSFACGNSYLTDHHDFQMIDNGHTLMIAYDSQIIDMSEIWPGGNPNASVIGLIIQELDSLRNVIFQWRSWDHFEITDAIHTDFTSNRVDYVHGNAIELDYDGNLLISCRHMDEVTKIDRQTGDIIWRLGLNATNNNFTFVGDTTGFCCQHDIRRLPNGNITVYDNGLFHTPQFSRAIEYELDEENKICTLVWEFRDNPDLFGAVNGNVQRLPNENTMIGWGGPSPITLTEVSPDGAKEFELILEGAPTTWSYRAFRFPWYGMAEAPYLLVEQMSLGIHLIFPKFGDTNVAKYYIYMDENPEPTTLVDSTSNTYLDLYDVLYGHTYCIRVTAVDEQSNESQYSNEVEIVITYECRYSPGDCNGDGNTNGSDVIYGVNYFKGGDIPPDSCWNDSTSNWHYSAADANGDCMFIGSDITYLVMYYRGSGKEPQYCPQTPPF